MFALGTKILGKELGLIANHCALCITELLNICTVPCTCSLALAPCTSTCAGGSVESVGLCRAWPGLQALALEEGVPPSGHEFAHWAERPALALTRLALAITVGDSCWGL